MNAVPIPKCQEFATFLLEFLGTLLAIANLPPPPHNLDLSSSMATAKSPRKTAPNLPEEEDLTDEQIGQLLARAAARLKQKSQSKELVQADETLEYTFPKLQTGHLEKPYVTREGDVATPDASRLLEEKQRKQANEIRKVEDPVTAKKAAVEVCESFVPSSEVLK